MASFTDETFFSSATELNARLRAREFSALELARAFCDRLDERGPRFNAVALMLREEALRKAREVDRDLKRGRTRGALQGIPYAVKDLFAYPGRPTTWGAKPYAGQVLETTASVLKKLDRNGAVLCGKLAMVELAGGGGYRYASASLTGPGLNPWDRRRWSGGSSSGSAAAVAAGLVPFSLGSETNGSIVTPAAFCGVTALRPTYGLVSRAGAMALAWSMDKVGPFARTAEDCGQILQAIAGGDSADQGSARRGFRFNPQFARAFKSLSVGWSQEDIEQSAEEEMRPALRAGLQILRDMGMKFVETRLPEAPYSALTSTIISAEGSTAFRELIESGRVDELPDARQIAGLRAGLEIPAADYLQAMRVRRWIQGELARLFIGIDILASPARFSLAPPVGDPLDRPSGTAPASQAGGLRSLVPAGNLAGLPALVLPCGSAGGMPVAISLVSRPFSENTLLAVGLEFQKRSTWHQARPAP